MNARFKIGWARIAALCRSEFQGFAWITFGSLCLCFAIAALFEPYRFVSTGVTGVALIANYLFGISPAWTLAAGNALLLLWGWRALSPRFALWTAYNTALMFVALPVFEMFSYPTLGNPILATLLGGVIGGFGMGILFREGASSGGMDVVAAVAKKRWGLDVGTASFGVNVLTLLLSLTAVDLERVVLGGLCLYVESLTVDFVIKSFDRRTQVMIVSSRPDEISRFIIESLERTATLISAKGAYRRAPVEMVLVILTRRQAMELKRFVRATDPDAFLIMGDVSEVVGEGFKKWDAAS